MCRCAAEVRYPSWFNEGLYGFFKEEEICLVWNPLDDVYAPSVLNTDFIYLRLSKNRSINEYEFDRI